MCHHTSMETAFHGVMDGMGHLGKRDLERLAVVLQQQLLPNYSIRKLSELCGIPKSTLEDTKILLELEQKQDLEEGKQPVLTDIADLREFSPSDNSTDSNPGNSESGLE